MTSIRNLLVASSALAFASCSFFNKGGEGNYDTDSASAGYDTSNPYGVPGGGSGESVPYQPTTPPANPTYSPAAYEDTSSVAPATTPAAPAAPTAPHTTPATGGSSGSARVHTVVKGDTLWGISKKYSVPVDSIKKANGMTKDTVVLGAKLQIPAN